MIKAPKKSEIDGNTPQYDKDTNNKPIAHTNWRSTESISTKMNNEIRVSSLSPLSARALQFGTDRNN